MAAYEPVARNYAIFPQVPNTSFGKVLTANTATDGTGTVVTCFTAGANGSLVDSISVFHLGTNVATVLRLFIKDGATYTLIFEKTIPTNTISQVAESTAYDVLFNGTDRKRLTLKAGTTIVASVGTTISAGINVTCFGGDY